VDKIQSLSLKILNLNSELLLLELDELTELEDEDDELLLDRLLLLMSLNLKKNSA
jgi:hypothetical protein